MSIACTQCGASIEPRAGERLLQCPYCSTALVVDGSATLYHEVMVPTVAVDQVSAHLRRFLGGTSTVADLDRKAKLGEPQLEYFPFWAFTVAGKKGERVVLQPAAPSSLQGLQGLELPAGSTRPMTPEITGEAPVIEPEVPFVGVAVLALIVFGLEGLFIQNLFIKLAVYLISAAPILAIAWLTSRKV